MRKWRTNISYIEHKTGTPSSTFRPLNAKQVRDIVSESRMENGKLPLKPATTYILNSLIDEHLKKHAENREVVTIEIEEVDEEIANV